MLEPILGEFGAFLRAHHATRRRRFPFVSNLSGKLDHRRRSRRSRRTGCATCGIPCASPTASPKLSKDGTRSCSRSAPAARWRRWRASIRRRAATQPVLNSLRHPDEQVSDVAFVLGVLGRLWTHGASVDWHRFNEGQRRRRVPLPTYRFDHQRHWVAAGAQAAIADTPPDRSLQRRTDVGRLVLPAGVATQGRCRQSERMTDATRSSSRTNSGLGAQLSQRLRDDGHDVAVVRIGAAFVRAGRRSSRSTPTRRATMRQSSVR